MTLHPPTGGDAIATEGLRKLFGSHVAVRDLSLTVPRGAIFGFLGPNGAGKSTSIKMLLGLVHPTSGSARVLSALLDERETRRYIGFLPEDFRFYDWLTAAELLRFHGSLCGMTSAALRKRVPEVLDLVGLAASADRRLRGFSKGMLQRIGLAQALVHQPLLLFLDEPTSGLDPLGRRMVRDILRAERERGTTVFLNSHLLGEIEATCDQVAFIKHGEVVATHDLRSAAADAPRVVAHVRGVTASVADGLAPWATDVHLDDERLTLAARSRAMLPDILRHLVAAGADVFEFRPDRVSLEDLFVTIMGEDPGL